VNPASLEALSLLATARFLSGDLQGFEEARDQALGQNPRYADFYNHLSDTCVRNRLYGEAAKFAQRALALDEKSWWGYGLLGLNQLRLGDIEDGRKNLETSFAGDPYNVWIKNTLDLLDTFPSYRETKSPRFATFIDKKESDLLALYATDLLEEAYDRLSSRYRYRPGTPIRVEVYPSHADFSVRTIGLAGLGALGVCFGPVLAIDSPSAREKGEFNWGSTLWHELAHTITLGMTDNKVPRWFSEGISVYEERRARPGWGDDVNIGFLMAYKQEKLLPIRELNNGFIRPTYPQQIGISYYQASLICELIEKEYGVEALLDILEGYKQGKDTETIFNEALGCDPDCLDEKLAEDLKERFGKAAASLPTPTEEGDVIQAATPESVVERAQEAPGDFLAQLAMGMKLLQEENLDEAEKYLERAKNLFPDYAGPDSPYWFLSQIHQKRGNLDDAREELSSFVAINGNHYEAHLQLAELEEKLGDESKAAEMLERALYVYPFEIEVHRRLADLYRGLEYHPGVIRERRALVATEVVDRAQVLYELALAYFEAGDSTRARGEVLRALEIAPSFDEALELLLKLQPSDSEVEP
jgi:tetratricopeptide (TPR) repeat protein